jgi:hypothetical protein
MYWYRCEKCREPKDVREFPVMREQETIIRSDSCEPCVSEIASIRARLEAQRRAEQRRLQPHHDRTKKRRKKTGVQRP